MDFNEIIYLLKSKGFKITEQRKTIIKVFIYNRNYLLSAEELLVKSREITAKTNISTIYRNLEILGGLNLLYTDIDENNTNRYKLLCLEKYHHHHLICKSCGKIEIIDFCPITNMTQLLKDKEFFITGHRFEVYGLCKNCRMKKK